jgi:uroporphyrinogen-III decarboxylase
MPLDMLAFATKEECTQYAKKILDDCAPGGGYIFATDKPLLSLSDAKPENLKAVLDLVKEYTY